MKKSRPQKSNAAVERDYQRLLQSVRGLMVELGALDQLAVQEYTPIIDQILRTRSRDTQLIQRTLDGLLGFCGHRSALVLYKRLCRHLWDLDQAATVEYVNAYREMFDPESLKSSR